MRTSKILNEYLINDLVNIITDYLVGDKIYWKNEMLKTTNLLKIVFKENIQIFKSENFIKSEEDIMEIMSRLHNKEEFNSISIRFEIINNKKHITVIKHLYNMIYVLKQIKYECFIFNH
jgi:hypothetical protein